MHLLVKMGVDADCWNRSVAELQEYEMKSQKSH